MRSILSASLLSAVLLSGCLVRTHGPRHHRPPPGEPAGPSNRAEEGAQAEEQTQASEQMKANERHQQEERAHQGEVPPPDRPPPPPREPTAPELSVELEPQSARPGQNVALMIRPFRPNVMVFFNGRPLPKRTEGERVIVTVPGNAHSGHFEVQWDGRRFRSPWLDVMR